MPIGVENGLAYIYGYGNYTDGQLGCLVVNIGNSVRALANCVAVAVDGNITGNALADKLATLGGGGNGGIASLAGNLAGNIALGNYAVGNATDADLTALHTRVFGNATFSDITVGNQSQARIALGLGDSSTHAALEFANAVSTANSIAIAQTAANNAWDAANAAQTAANSAYATASTAQSAAGAYADELIDNISLASLGAQPAGNYCTTANNLSDLGNAAAARANLGLGDIATHSASEFANATATAGGIRDAANAAASGWAVGNAANSAASSAWGTANTANAAAGVALSLANNANSTASSAWATANSASTAAGNAYAKANAALTPTGNGSQLTGIDYTQISGLANVAHSGNYSALSGLPTLGTAASQNSGAFDAAGAANAVQTNLDTLSANAVLSSDSRLSNARTPTTHASTHAANGADPITPASIGAQAVGNYVTTSNNLSDLGNITTARSNLGLGNAALATTTGNVAASGNAVPTANAVATYAVPVGGTVLLNYRAKTDLANATTFAATTWGNIGSAQTFRVTNGAANIRVSVGGGVQVGGNNTESFAAYVSSAILIDNATRYVFSLGKISTDGVIWANAMNGAAPVCLGAMSVGNHTVQVQIYPSSGEAVYCRPASVPTAESLYILVEQT